MTLGNSRSANVKKNALKKRVKRHRSVAPYVPRARDLLTAREVAARCGLGLTAVYQEIKARRLAAQRVGNRAYVSEPAYQRWLQQFGMPTAG